MAQREEPKARRPRRKTEPLSLEDLKHLWAGLNTAWQPQLQELGAGKTQGFRVRLEAYKTGDEARDRRLMEEETRGIATAIKYHLRKAAEAQWGVADPERARQLVVVRRRVDWEDEDYPGIVEVFVRSGVQLPEKFARYLSTFNMRLGRRPKGWRGALDGGREIETTPG